MPLAGLCLKSNISNKFQDMQTLGHIRRKLRGKIHQDHDDDSDDESDTQNLRY